MIKKSTVNYEHKSAVLKHLKVLFSKINIITSRLVIINNKMGCTKVCNHPQPPTTTHNHLQSSTIIHNHSQPLTTTHNHPEPPTAIQNYPKGTQKSQNLPPTAICYCTLDANIETDVGFDSSIKQWYIYMFACVSVCI